MNQKSGADRRPGVQRFTEKQGQYLAYIYANSRLHRRPPTAGRTRHAAIFPRQPTFGSPNGVNARTRRVHQKET
jgi:hypothetical protein